MKRTISAPALTEQRSDERNLRELVNQLRADATLMPRLRVTGTTDGAGTYKAIWSDQVPEGASAFLQALVLAVGTGNDAWYQVSAGVRCAAGVLTVIGATAVTVEREEAAASDARFAVSGATISLEVRDDAVNPANWTAIVSYLAAA